MLWRLLNIDIKCLLVTLARTSTYGIRGALTTGPSVLYVNVILNVWRARFLGIHNSTVCGSSDIGCRVARWTIGATVSPTTFLMYLQIVVIVLPIPKHLDRCGDIKSVGSKVLSESWGSQHNNYLWESGEASMTRPKGFEVGCWCKKGWSKTIWKREEASEGNPETRRSGWWHGWWVRERFGSGFEWKVSNDDKDLQKT